MRILLVRHGQSEWNASRRLQGQADIGLSDIGRSQADSLRPTIEAIGCCRAITSDLSRVQETASRIGAPDAIPNQRLREMDVGDWTGRAIEDIQAEDIDNYLAWRAGTFTPPKGEAWGDFSARVRGVIDEAQREPCQNLLVVCHGGVIRALLQSFLNLAPACIIPVAPASLTVFRLANEQSDSARLELFNYRPERLDFEAPD